ncbi:MAG: hypothetical protein Q8P11_02280 [bacterium]|nr:hypothetical protein [bacterium]
MNSKTNLYKRIAGTFFIFSLLVALAVFYFSFSWATIIVKPVAQSFSATQLFSLTDTVVHSPDEVNATIHSEVLRGEGHFDISGSKQVVGNLTGTITLLNKTSTDQPLRATTRLLSANDVLFRMDDFATVPAHGEVVVDVRADKEGDVGSVDGSHFTIPGLWEGTQTQIYGESFVPRQSAVHTVKIVQKADIVNAQKSLMDRLQTKFREKLSALGQGDYQAIDSKVINTDFSANEGEEAATLNATIEAQFVAVSFDRQIVYDRMIEHLKEKLSVNEELISPEPSSLEYIVTMKGEDLSQIQLRVSGEAKKVISQDPRLFDVQSLVGKSQAEIVAYFGNFDDIDSVKVSLYPFWVFRAPTLTDHIHILLDTR